MGSFGTRRGSSQQQTRPAFTIVPEENQLLTQDEGRSFALRTGGLASQLEQGLPQGNLNSLEQAILNPDFNLSGAQHGLLDSIMDQVGARSAVRGLGVPPSGALARSVAPALAEFQQQGIQNLMGTQQLAQNQQADTIQTLLNLALLGKPQVIAGQRGTGRSSESGFNFGIDLSKAGGAFGLGTT